MTALAITGMGLTGVLRLTWVHDNLAHVLEHCQADEPSGTWTGLAGPGHELALGADVDNAALRQLADGSEIADLIWEAPTSSPPSTPRYSRPPCALTTPATPSAPSSSGRTSGPSGHTPGRRTTQYWSSCRARA
jgi:hypothetical protein